MDFSEPISRLMNATGVYWKKATCFIIISSAKLMKIHEYVLGI